MNCIDFQKQIALYVGGDILEKDLIIVEKHLAVCKTCRVFMVELQESQLSLVKFGDIDLPESVFTNLRASVLSQIAISNQKISWWQQFFSFFYSWRYALVTSALLLTISIPAYFLFLNSSETNNTKQSAKENSKVLKKADLENSTKLKKDEINRKNESNDLVKLESQTKKFSNTKLKSNTKIFHKVSKINQINKEINVLDNNINNNQEIVKNINLNEESSLAIRNIAEPQVKMEIQTSNPNIRIIWLVNKEEKSLEKRTNS
ncbi:MAG: zf-HC2 domain-containing protein [Acidobacteria bacterium]|nr:zf-HC2 domain-containing protein [Acidobacteriota bacterium]